MGERLIDLLENRWTSSGIEKGDMVLVHSSLRRTMAELSEQQFKCSVNDILDSLVGAVGIEGTLLFPLFNFDFTKGVPFDINETPSQMGALTEAARKHPEACRTGHPIYSFASIGRHSHLFGGVNNMSAYSEESPFGILKNCDGKIAVIDLQEQDSMTFYHHVEECLRVPYRYFKSFCGLYTDSERKTTEKTYQIFVRDIEANVRTHVNPAGEMLWEAGCYKGSRPMTASGMRTIRAAEVYQLTKQLIEEGRALGNLYLIEE